MPDKRLPEVEFSDFVGRLIQDTFEAVITSMITQQERAAEIQVLASSEISTRPEALVDEGEIELELIRLFPDPESDPPHRAIEGAAYRPTSEGMEEDPPFKVTLGVVLDRSDYTVHQKGPSRITLKKSGAEKVRDAVVRGLAESRFASLREIARSGTPRVIVEGGRILAKVSYSLKESDTNAKRGLIHRALHPGRLVVSPIDPRDPQNSDLKIDLFGEIELRFKSII